MEKKYGRRKTIIKRKHGRRKTIMERKYGLRKDYESQRKYRTLRKAIMFIYSEKNF